VDGSAITNNSTVTIYADQAVDIDTSDMLAQVLNGDATVDIDADNSTLDIATSTVNATVTGNGDAAITIDANNSTIAITSSTVKSAVTGDGDADITITGDLDITITNSDIESNVTGNGDSSISITSNNGSVTITNTIVGNYVKALVTGDGDALIDIKANGGDVIIHNGTITAKVDGATPGNTSTINIYADQAVDIDPTAILAQVVNGTATIDIEANNSTLDITDSTVKAIVTGACDADIDITADGDITISDSDVEANVALDGSSSITITSSGSVAITNTAAGINFIKALVSGDGKATIDIYANGGSFTMTNADVHAIVSGLAATNSAIITISSLNDLTPGNIHAEATTSTINLTSTAGSILDDTDETNSIAANNVNLTAADSIGTSLVDGDIDLDADTIKANAGADIYIEEADGALFEQVISTGGLINILAHGSSSFKEITANNTVTIKVTSGDITIYVGGIKANTAGVTVTADTGSILPQAAAGAGEYHIISNGDLVLNTPQGVIGTSAIPLKIKLVSGTLSLDIGGVIGALYSGFSGNLSGDLPAGIDPEADPGSILKPSFFTSVTNLYPKGEVFWNTIKIWPPAFTGDISSQTAETLSIKYQFPPLGQLEDYQVNPSDLMSSSSLSGPVLFYHPLTPTDMEAFREFEVEQGAYSFMNGAISLTGHAGLLPMLEEVKKNKAL
jgi:hypothetical protein